MLSGGHNLTTEPPIYPDALAGGIRLHHVSEVELTFPFNTFLGLMRLRNLLPSDNFSESEFVRYRLYARILYDTAAHTLGYLTSGSDALSSQPSKSDSMDTSFQRKNVSGFKIMTITRGFTEEADKLLNYMVSPVVLSI